MARLTGFGQHPSRIVSCLVAESWIADAICLGQLCGQTFQRLREGGKIFRLKAKRCMHSSCTNAQKGSRHIRIRPPFAWLTIQRWSEVLCWIHHLSQTDPLVVLCIPCRCPGNTGHLIFCLSASCQALGVRHTGSRRDSHHGSNG
jgi:hypothetical protein